MGSASQRAIAARLGLSQSTVSRYLRRGNTEPGEGTIGLVTGVNGKSYITGITPQIRNRLIEITHEISHSEGLSVRGIVAALRDRYEVPRGAGTVHRYLTSWRCPDCPTESNASVEQRS